MTLLWYSRKYSGAALALAAVLVAAGCGSGKGDGSASTTTRSAAGAPSITLVESAHDLGPWSRELSLPLGKAGVPVQFYVCAVRSKGRPAKPCTSEGAGALPHGGTLRLEQQPVGPGVERADTPGWGLVGTGEEGFMKVVLSDFVSTSNKPGRITYRVTQRDAAGHIVATSNTVVVNWQR
jgi:hypothetical protein